MSEYQAFFAQVFGPGLYTLLGYALSVGILAAVFNLVQSVTERRGGT